MMRSHSEMKQARSDMKHAEPRIAQMHGHKPYVMLLISLALSFIAMFLLMHSMADRWAREEIARSPPRPALVAGGHALNTDLMTSGVRETSSGARL